MGGDKRGEESRKFPQGRKNKIPPVFNLVIASLSVLAMFLS